MPHRPRHPFAAGLLCGLIYSLLFGIACRWPEGPTPMLAWLSPAPLLACGLSRGFTWRTCAGAGVGAMAFWGYWHHWVWTNDVSRVGFVLMTVYLAMWTAAFPLLLATLRRRLGLAWAIVAIPFVWTALEYLRGEVLFYGYPWYLIAHPLIESEVARRLASAVGVYMVGFVHLAAWAVFTGVVFGVRRAALGRGARIAVASLSGAAFAAIAVLSMLVPAGRAGGETRAVRIAVVQTNVPQTNREAWSIEQRVADFNRFAELTLRSAEREPDLIIWPETMYPGFYGLTPDAIVELERAAIGIERFPQLLLKLQEWAGAPMLIGAVAVHDLQLTVGPDGAITDEVGRKYNSVYLLEDAAITDQRYDKLKLTPFGEVLPYFEWWPPLERMAMGLGARGMSFSLSRGEAPRLIGAHVRDGESLRLATPICFEATMPALCRRLAAQDGGADLMVNLTNDGWFGDFDPGRRMHLNLARWRAAELAIPMVRAANTGISAAIASDGALQAAGPNLGPPGAPARDDGVMLVDLELPTARRPTLYARIGDWPAAVCAVLTALGVLLALARRPRARRVSQPLPEPAEPTGR